LLTVNKDYFTKRNGDDIFDNCTWGDTRWTYVINVEEITFYVYGVGEGKAQILGKSPGYFNFLSFSRPMARCEYES